MNSRINVNNVVYDDVTNYGITIINNDMYLVKDDRVMKLSALIIKERKEREGKA